MQFSYSRLPSRDPSYPYFLRLLLDIRLHRGPASIPLKGVIDTGADQTLINVKFAELLYIDWKSGAQSWTTGISGGREPVWLHNLEIEVVGMPNGKVRTLVGFVKLKNVSVLLGQYGFLEHFLVSVNAKNETFEVDPS